MKPADLDKQYARFPKIQRSEVQKFVRWIHAQPHFQNLTEEETLHFYHACKCSMEVSKQVLDINLTVRTHCDEFFSNLDSDCEELKRAMNIFSVIPLQGSTPEGYRVLLMTLIESNASYFNFADVIKLAFMVFDFWMYTDGIQPGLLLVVDLQGITLGHIPRVSILQIKKFLYYLQEAAALRLIGFHFINLVPFMDKILALMKPFMKKELTGMLYLHNDLSELYKFIPRDILPKDYGGAAEECKNLREMIYEKLRESRNDMLEFEKQHQVNEKLRPGKPKNATDLFGIEGNFKKLDID